MEKSEPTEGATDLRLWYAQVWKRAKTEILKLFWTKSLVGDFIRGVTSFRKFIKIYLDSTTISILYNISWAVTIWLEAKIFHLKINAKKSHAPPLFRSVRVIMVKNKSNKELSHLLPFPLFYSLSKYYFGPSKIFQSNPQRNLSLFCIFSLPKAFTKESNMGELEFCSSLEFLKRFRCPWFLVLPPSL